ncbi:MAG: hypothetical protein K5979_12435 [Ruminococcus sp.]|nr:hypothetical protein [Ruminococcus sp.]
MYINIDPLSVYDHNDELGYHYKKGETIFEREKMFQRLTLADHDIPKQGVTNKMLMYSITSAAPLLVIHRDSDKVPGGDQRPAHYIEVNSVTSENTEPSGKLVTLMVAAAFECENIVCVEDDKAISTVVNAMIFACHFIPEELKEKFYIRIIPLEKLTALLDALPQYFIVFGENFGAIPNMYQPSEDEKIIDRYIREVISKPETVGNLEHRKQFSTDRYIEIIRKNYTEALPVLSTEIMQDVKAPPEEKTKTDIEKLCISRLIQCFNYKLTKKRIINRRKLLGDIIYEYSLICNPTIPKEEEYIGLINMFAEHNSSNRSLLIFINSLRSYMNNSCYQTKINAKELKKYYRTLKKINHKELLPYITVDSSQKAMKLYEAYIEEVNNEKEKN